MNLKSILATKAAIITVVAIIVVIGGGWGSAEYYTSQSSFCGGSCHIMDEQYQAWKSSNHHASNSAEGTQAECVDCHFLPGEKSSIDGKLVGLRHLAAYLHDPNAPLPIRAKIPDGACLSSGCHDKTKFQDKEIKFTEKVTFTHKPHFDKGIDDQEIFCETCHFKQSADKHFEVPQETCFLCHLKGDVASSSMGEEAANEDGANEEAANEDGANEDGAHQVSLNTTLPTGLKAASRSTFNQGLGKCDTCHVIPTKSLQAQRSKDDTQSVEPITHQSLIEANVPCESCHLHQIAGNGDINTGKVNADGCMNCHSASDELLAKASDKATMHGEHIADKRADCFDCHDVIKHGQVADYLDAVGSDCAACHPDEHKYQRILLSGAEVVDGVSGTPGLMHRVTTNCLGCHTNSKDLHGKTVMAGAGESCVSCHTEKHDKMLQDWKDFLTRELKLIKELEQEAAQAIEAARGQASEQDIAEAESLLAKGRNVLSLVEYGNGVHNRKYSVNLIDEAYGSFDDVIYLLDSGN